METGARPRGLPRTRDFTHRRSPAAVRRRGYIISPDSPADSMMSRSPGTKHPPPGALFRLVMWHASPATSRQTSEPREDPKTGSRDDRADTVGRGRIALPRSDELHYGQYRNPLLVRRVGVENRAKRAQRVVGPRLDGAFRNAEERGGFGDRTPSVVDLDENLPVL